MGKTHDISENTGSCLSAVTYPPWIVLLWTREGVGGKGWDTRARAQARRACKVLLQAKRRALTRARTQYGSIYYY